MKDFSSRNIIMGLQHTFVMFGATVLVPILTGLDIGVTLLATGIGTLLFHLITKNMVPIYLGSSFAFIAAIQSISATSGMPYALGGIFGAGVMFMLVGLLLNFISIESLHKILPAWVTGPMIVLIGLILAPVAISNANGANSPYLLNSIGTNGCWLLALSVFAVSVFVKIYFAKIGLKFLSMLPVLISLVFGFIISSIFGLIDWRAVMEANWLGLPTITSPKFSINALSITVPIALVAIVEHFGDVLAIGNVAGKDFLTKPGINRTLFGDGVASCISSSLGGPVLTTYSENTGAVALTGNTNPIIMRFAAGFAIILAFIPKFTELIKVIPGPVIGGISILLFGMISSIGIKNMIDAKVDFSNPKILIISASMLVIGLGNAKFAYGNFQLEGLGLAAIVGMLLNLILNFGDIIGKKKAKKKN